MGEKSTNELNSILKNTHLKELPSFLEEHAKDMIYQDHPFALYMRKIINEKGISRQTIFLQADIPERYGYKLLSEEKRTRQRDVILRICYSAYFTLEETQ